LLLLFEVVELVGRNRRVEIRKIDVRC
jgi:hypothetical protein